MSEEHKQGGGCCSSDSKGSSCCGGPKKLIVAVLVCLGILTIGILIGKACGKSCPFAAKVTAQ